jgi:hypothetical protein
MKGPPTPSGSILRAQSQGPNQKRKPPTKTKYTRFSTLVGRYYPAVYSFASRLTDDPREAVLLTHGAFNTIRKRRWRLRDEVMLATILLNAVIVAGLNSRSSTPQNGEFNPIRRIATVESLGPKKGRENVENVDISAQIEFKRQL